MLDGARSIPETENAQRFSPAMSSPINRALATAAAQEPFVGHEIAWRCPRVKPVRGSIVGAGGLGLYERPPPRSLAFMKMRRSEAFREKGVPDRGRSPTWSAPPDDSTASSGVLTRISATMSMACMLSTTLSESAIWSLNKVDCAPSLSNHARPFPSERATCWYRRGRDSNCSCLVTLRFALSLIDCSVGF